MKSERRHELQTNELANWLARQFERYRAQLPTIAWGVVAVLAMVLAISLWSSREGNSTVGAWEEFSRIGTLDAKARPKRLKELAERYPNSDIALWARLDLADQLCFDGRNKLDIDREIAITHLREAQQTYAAVLQNSKLRPEMIRRAALAEGKCFELVGDREKAIESYKAVAKKYAQSLPEVANDAAGRASDLEQPEAADFYKWLTEYKPPATRALSLPGLGPDFPPIGDAKENSTSTNDPADKETPKESIDSKTSEKPKSEP